MAAESKKQAGATTPGQFDPEPVSALAELYPEPTVVHLPSGPVELKGLPFDDFVIGTRVVAVFLNLAMPGDEALTFVEQHKDDLFRFVAASSGIDPEVLRRTYGGHVMALAVGAAEANRDFLAGCFSFRFGKTAVAMAQMLMVDDAETAANRAPQNGS